MTDLLDRLQHAVPRMQRWMGDLHAAHAAAAASVASAGIPRLDAHFPASTLVRARVVLAAALPFPPVTDFGLPEFEPLAASPRAGVTFGSMYFLHPAHTAPGIHFHELVHVVQWRVLGVADFLQTYVVGLAQHGYERSPLEAIAFELQDAFEGHQLIGSPVDVIAQHARAARHRAAELFAAHGLDMRRVPGAGDDPTPGIA
jgi:hypothetical protein